jgi:hypothetical protein
MAIKIEKKRLNGGGLRSARVQEFINALKELEVGESFVISMNAQDRQAMSLAQYILGRRFGTAAEGSLRRVARLS